MNDGVSMTLRWSSGDDRREIVLDDEVARGVHGGAVLVERLDERRGMVVLDEVRHLERVERRVDLGAHRVAGRDAVRQHLLAHREDLVAGRLQLAKSDDLLELLRAGLPVRGRLRQHHVPEVGRVPLERGVRRVRRRLQPPRQGWVAAVGRRRGHDRGEERGKRLRALDVDLRPEADRLRHPRLGLVDHPRRLLQARGDRLEALRQRGEVAREQREEPLTDLLGRVGATLPRPSLGERVERQPSLVDDEVAVEGVVGGQVLGAEALHLRDRAAMMGDQRVDVLPRGGRQVAIVVVDAEVRGDHGLEREPVAEPAVDRPREAGIGVALVIGHQDS